MKSLGIDRFSLEERIELVHEICASLDEESAPLTDEQMRDVDRRLAEHAANPAATVAWDIVEAEALARIRR